MQRELRLFRIVLGVGLAALVVASTSSRPRAAVIIAVTFPARVAAGSDYATEALGDPWDMCNPQDVSPFPPELAGFSAFAFSSNPCRAGGTTSTADSSVAFLHRGLYGIVNPGRNGRRFPIDTSKYRTLSYKLSSTATGQNPQVYWFHNPFMHPAGDGMGVLFAPPTVGGTQIAVVDLTQTPASGVPWTSGAAVGFRLDPNSTSVGHDVFFYWVRLSAPRTHSITWTGGTASAITVTDHVDGSSYTVAENVASGYNWNYGVLPPGDYTLTVTTAAGIGTATFSINHPPSVQIIDPSATTGEDYATKVLGNPWDMSDSADLQVTGLEHVSGLTFASGQATATNTNSDPNVTLLNAANDAVPIDTSKYRYLTWRFKVDGQFDLGAGSVARVLWSSVHANALGANSTTTKDIIVWPGMNSYTIDLAALSTSADGGLVASGAATPWTGALVRNLRLDPHEFPNAHAFHIDDVKLTARPVSNGTFDIKFAAEDADGDSVTVSLYYDNDSNPVNGKTAIASGIPGTAEQFTWNTAAVTPGDYYIYAEATDGIQSSGRYSEVPVRVVEPGSLSSPLMSLDAPVNGATLLQPFAIGGWAIDRGSIAGSGVDVVHLYAYPSSGSPVFLGVAASTPRPDVGAAFGAQFSSSGYGLTVSGLPPGRYTLAAFAHSTVTGTFNQSRTAIITLPASAPGMSLDAPRQNATVGPTFAVGGWAIDRVAGAGTGVDAVHVWAYPNPGSGQAPIFLGVSSYGGHRPDVGGIFGSRFTDSGFALLASGLSPGKYLVVAYAHSTVTGTFTITRQAAITVVGSAPVLSIDTPRMGAHTGTSFAVAGWAIDRSAYSGTGIDTVHIYAYRNPGSGATPIFLGVAEYGRSRPDVGGVFGAQYTNSGYSLVSPALANGTYDVVVFAHSVVAGAFNQAQVVRVIIP